MAHGKSVSVINSMLTELDCVTAKQLALQFFMNIFASFA